LWADVRDGWAARIAQRQHAHPALQDAIDDVFNARIGDVSGRGKLAGDMREIWMMQPRFERRVGSAPFGLVDQPRFRAAFDFMRLRADAGEIDDVLADWWQEFSVADDNLRQDMVDQVREEQLARPRAARVHRASKPAGAGEPAGTVAPERAQATPPGDTGQGEGGTEAPKKRRRRRRGGAGTRDGAPTPDAGS
jgi:poly(A) polymerase